jgi:hypothetical protein
MSQAEANPGSTQQRQIGSGARIDLGCKGGSRSNRPAKDSVFVLGSAGLLVTLCIALLLSIFIAIAFAQAHEDENTAPGVAALPASGALELTASAFDPAALPPLDAIDAQTDITVFLQNGVPAELRLVALRRAWSADPAIRDFKGMQENGWDFDRPNSIPGFGELGPEVDVKQMVARIFGDTPRLELARSTSLLRRRP